MTARASPGLGYQIETLVLMQLSNGRSVQPRDEGGEHGPVRVVVVTYHVVDETSRLRGG